MSLAPGSATRSTAQFVTGSLWRHILVMAGTGSIGLVAVFAVDLITLFYLALLGRQEILAAAGFAGVVGFFHISLCVGLTIGVTAVVARLVGADRMEEARRVGATGLALVTAITLVVALLTGWWLGPIVEALGAREETAALTHRFLLLSVFSLPLLGLGMASSALLRSIGDARYAMMVTLGAALLTAVVDPLLIFGLGLGFDGAAIGLVCSRLAMAAIGLYGVLRRHHLLARPDARQARGAIVQVLKVAAPAVLTNLATPVGSAFITGSVARFGPSAVAGYAVIERISPVAFGLIFALSGAIGPILAQNLGAGRIDRVRAGLRASVIFTIVAVIGAWVILVLCESLIIRMFSVDGEAARLISIFCRGLALGYLFMGALFVANAAFNNLGRPLWSTGFNWARATIGTIPLAWLGSHHGPAWVIAGSMAGALVFGLLALRTAYRLIDTLEQRAVVMPPRTQA